MIDNRKQGAPFPFMSKIYNFHAMIFFFFITNFHVMIIGAKFGFVNITFDLENNTHMHPSIVYRLSLNCLE